MTARGPIRRVLVAIDGSEANRPAIDTAAALAARLDAELLSLFVEDIQMLHLAELGAGSLYSMVRGGREPLTRDGAARLIRAQAARGRVETEGAARRHGIRPPRMIVRRGTVADEVVSALEDGDLVVLGWAGRAVSRRGAPGRTANRIALKSAQPVLMTQRALDGPVMVAFDGSPAAEGALATAVLIDPEPIIALLAPDRGAEESLREMAEKIIGSGSVTYRSIGAGGTGALAALVARQNAALLVLARATANRLGDPEAQRIARCGCSLLWVG